MCFGIIRWCVATQREMATITLLTTVNSNSLILVQFRKIHPYACYSETIYQTKVLNCTQFLEQGESARLLNLFRFTNIHSAKQQVHKHPAKNRNKNESSVFKEQAHI